MYFNLRSSLPIILKEITSLLSQNAKSLLLKNKDNEEKLFVQLAAKFSGVNALEICGDKIGKGSLCLDSIKEMVAEETVISWMWLVKSFPGNCFYYFANLTSSHYYYEVSKLNMKFAIQTNGNISPAKNSQPAISLPNEVTN